MINNFKIIDGHIHTFSSVEVSRKIIDSFNKAYDIEFDNPGTGDIDDVIANMSVSGVDYSIMANFAPPGILHKNNLWTIEQSRRHACLVPLVSFHPDMEGRLCSLLDSYINEGAKGIKLHPMAQGFNPVNKRLEEVYGFCGEAGIPIVFHCGRVANARLNEYSDLNILLRVIDSHPDTNFILTHMADGNIEDVMRIAGNYSNVYFDTSIIITGYPPLVRTNKPSWIDNGQVVDVINAVGAEKVVFGSDYPWGSPRHDLDRILGLNLSGDQFRQILSGNAMKLFRLGNDD